MKEKLLFILPKDPEEALWSISVVHAFILERYARSTPCTPSFWLYALMPLELRKFISNLLLCYFGRKIQIFDSLAPDNCVSSEFDLVVSLSSADARILGQTLGKHITESMGILVGSLPMRTIPVVKTLFPSNEKTILFLSDYWINYPAFAVQATELGLHTLRIVNPGAGSLKDISEATLVIGTRSIYTLVAAAMGQNVFEFFAKPDEYEFWRAKPFLNCRVLLGNPDMYPADYLFKVVKDFLRQRGLLYGLSAATEPILS